MPWSSVGGLCGSLQYPLQPAPCSARIHLFHVLNPPHLGTVLLGLLSKCERDSGLNYSFSGTEAGLICNTVHLLPCLENFTSWDEPGSSLAHHSHFEPFGMVSMAFLVHSCCTCPFTVKIGQGSTKRQPNGSLGYQN